MLPSLTGLAMSGAGPDDAGLASGLFNTVQQVGMALGVAVMTTLAASRITDLRAAGHAEPAALTGGYHLAFSVSAGLLIAALAVSLLVLRNPGPPPSDTRTQDLHTRPRVRFRPHLRTHRDAALAPGRGHAASRQASGVGLNCNKTSAALPSGEEGARR